MASGDTPLNTNAAFQARQERLGSATMVLSVGNKSTAPGVENFQSSTTPDMAKQPKASSSKKRQQQGISGQDTVNLTPMLDTTSGAGTPTGDGGVTPATAPKRAGFKRVGKREAEESPAPQSDSSKRSRQE